MIVLIIFLLSSYLISPQTIPVSERNPTNVSTFLRASRIANYEPSNVIDHDLSTAWVEGVDGDGIGEWVAIYLGKLEELKDISEMELEIRAGYQKDNESLQNNAIPTSFLIELFLDNNKIVTSVLPEPIINRFNNEENSQINKQLNFGIRKINLYSQIDEHIKTGTVWLKLTILKVNKGIKWEDTAISEIIWNFKKSYSDQVKYFLIIADEVYVYDIPGSSGEKLGICKKSKKYQVLDENNSGWTKVNYDGNSGWISSFAGEYIWSVPTADELPELKIENKTPTQQIIPTYFNDTGIQLAVGEYLQKNMQSSLDYVSSIYSNKVDYYNSGIVDKNFIIKDKKEYFIKWPIRNYAIASEIAIVTGNEERTCIVKFNYHFNVKNSQRERNGDAWCQLIYKEIGNSLLIISEKGGILK